MSSPEQIEANRRNAALSTGPRTEAGKAASSLNASRHGLLARELLVKGESKANFTAFAEGVRERLAPDGELENFVVNRVISAAWRLRRAVAVEAALFTTDNGHIGAVPGGVGKMQLLSRYEVTLERSLYKALEGLDHLRRVREKTAVKAAVNENLDRIRRQQKEKSQENPDEIGFVSQKCENPEN
jgi:hypothetical protein